MPVKKQWLTHFALIRDIAKPEIDSLAQAARSARYPAAGLIFSDGQPGDTFYLIRAGIVEIVKTNRNGEVILNVLQPGDHFGEMSLLDEQPRSAAARARTDVTLIEIPKAAFLTLVQKSPLMLYRAARVSDARLRQRDQVLLDELATHNRRLEKLYATSLDISRHLDLDRAFDAMIRRAAELLDGETGVLHLYQPASGQLVTHSPLSAPPAMSNASRRAFSTSQPVIDKRARTLAAPICLGTETLGVLTVYRALKSIAFTQDDANLLLLLANQCAIAIENARLYGLAVEKGRMDGELHAALSVQRNLMPTRAPRIPGYRIAGVWQPARIVAGDFFDYIPLGNHQFGVVIADVSDKGMPAALFMAATRSIIRASIIEEPDPGCALTRANRLIASDATDGMFVTLFLGVLDARAHRFTFANAGHNPPWLWRARTNRIESLRQHQLALGILSNVEYATHQIDFEPGDALLLYTDGVTDAKNARQQFFGEHRLKRSFNDNARADAPALVRQIESAVRAFVGAEPLFDDITLLGLSRTIG